MSDLGTMLEKIMKSGHQRRVRAGTGKGFGQALEKVESGQVSEK